MKLLPIAALLLNAALLAAQGAQAQDVAAVTRQIDGMYPKLDAIYKYLHQHPEIAFQ
jgi:metal-dependent amidase/aminoacylase/carboxypeptidase family protein